LARVKGREAEDQRPHETAGAGAPGADADLENQQIAHGKQDYR
jgi:hypothetical protein